MISNIQIQAGHVHKHTSTTNNSCRMIELFFAKLRDLIQLLRANHQPIATDEFLKLGRVDHRFAAARMSKRRLNARQQWDLKRYSACDGRA
jgi:hypothetical protein